MPAAVASGWAEAMADLRAEQPMGKFAGLSNYLNHNHLAIDDLRQILAESKGLGDIAPRLMNLPFYRALAFTLAYCFVVTPLAMGLGFAVALAVNTMSSECRTSYAFSWSTART